MFDWSRSSRVASMHLKYTLFSMCFPLYKFWNEPSWTARTFCGKNLLGADYVFDLRACSSHSQFFCWKPIIPLKTLSCFIGHFPWSPPHQGWGSAPLDACELQCLLCRRHAFGMSFSWRILILGVQEKYSTLWKMYTPVKVIFPIRISQKEKKCQKVVIQQQDFSKLYVPVYVLDE